MNFQKIAKVNLDDGWGVELGYEVPAVITDSTQVNLTTRITQEDPNKEIDVESLDYKKAESVAEVLKIGFDLGCSYTMRVTEQVTKMGQSLMEDAPKDAEVTGAANDLFVEE